MLYMANIFKHFEDGPGSTEEAGLRTKKVYEGRTCLGKPVFSMQRGRIVIEDGEMKGRPGEGRFLVTKIEAKSVCNRSLFQFQ